MNIPLVDLDAGQKNISEEIQQTVARVLEEGRFIAGKEVPLFENAFAQETGTKYCVAVSSGTAAVYLALRALGIGKGDEVITVPNTFIATTEAISLTGATIVFVDVEDETLLMDVSKVEEKITERTRAIVPVHLYGQMCDMQKLSRITKEHDLFLVEDAAQAHLATHNAAQPAEVGDVACYSFFPAKNLGGIGDGGGVTTNDQELAEKIRRLKDHGRTEKYLHQEEGFNFRLDTIQAAVLAVKLPHLSLWNKQRAEAATYYTTHLSNLVRTPIIKEENTSSYYMYVIRTEKRDELQQYLKERGIATGIHYPISLHLQPAYKHLNLKEGSFPVSEKASKEILSLPIYPGITKEQQDYVINHLRKFFTVSS